MTSSAQSTESIYSISASGRVESMQKPPGQELWRFYLSALQCESFTVVLQHRVEVAGTRTDFTLLLLGDEEAILRGLAVLSEPKEARKRKNLQFALHAHACSLRCTLGAICSGSRYAKWAGGSR